MVNIWFGGGRFLTFQQRGGRLILFEITNPKNFENPDWSLDCYQDGGACKSQALIFTFQVNLTDIIATEKKNRHAGPCSMVEKDWHGNAFAKRIFGYQSNFQRLS